MKVYLIFFICIILLSALLITVKAEEPKYNLDMLIFDKNIEIGEKLDFGITIFGGGICENATLLIDPEIQFNLSEIKFDFQKDDNHPVQILFNRIDIKKYQNNKVVRTSYPTECIDCMGITASTTGLMLPSEALPNDSNSFYVYSFDAKSRDVISSKAPGGIYKIKATFNCYYNGRWYLFEDEGEFHIKTKLEQWEFSFAFIALIFSVISIIVAIIALKKK